MKKYLMLMLLLSMSFVLMACGGEETPEDSSLPETPVTEGESETPSEPDDSSSEDDTPTDDSTDDSTDESTDVSDPDESTDDTTEESDGYEDPDFSGGDETTDDSNDDSNDESTDDSGDATSDSGDASTDDSSDDAVDEPTEEDNGLDGPGRINEEGQVELTLEELAYYDGTDGKPAYVAVDGEIYDMTNSSHWSGGSHYSGNRAGRDLSEEIRRSPHGLSNLARVPKIGILVESEVE